MFPTRCRGTFITTEIFPLVSVGTSPSTESRREMDRFRIPQSLAARIDPSVFSNGISVKRLSRENLERKLERLRYASFPSSKLQIVNVQPHPRPQHYDSITFPTRTPFRCNFAICVPSRLLAPYRCLDKSNPRFKSFPRKDSSIPPFKSFPRA